MKFRSYNGISLIFVFLLVIVIFGLVFLSMFGYSTVEKFIPKQHSPAKLELADDLMKANNCIELLPSVKVLSSDLPLNLESSYVPGLNFFDYFDIQFIEKVKKVLRRGDR